MSIEGVKIFADVLSIMQEERNKLMNLGCSYGFKRPSKSNKQDMLLG